MENRIRRSSSRSSFPASPLQKYLATPRYKPSFQSRSYQQSPRSMHRVTYLNGHRAKVYNTSYLYPQVENPDNKVDLIGKKNRLLLITPRRHRSIQDLSPSPKKSQSLFESRTSSSLSVPSSPYLSRRSGSEPYRSYSYQELYSPKSPSTPRRSLLSSRRTYSTSDLTFSSPSSKDKFYYDYPSFTSYRRWTSNYDISYVPDHYSSMDALYGYRKAGSCDVLFPPSPSFFDFRPFSRSESGYYGYEFRSRSGSGSIIRSNRSDIGDYHHSTRSECDFPLRHRPDLGEYRPATRSECDYPVRHRGPSSKSECGVSPNDIATRSESGFSITLSDFDNSFTMADDDVSSISSMDYAHDRSLDNLLVFPMPDFDDRHETDSVVSHDRTLDIINEDENSDPDQDDIKPVKTSVSVSLLSRFEDSDKQSKIVEGDEDDEVFRQHTDTIFLSNNDSVTEEEVERTSKQSDWHRDSQGGADGRIMVRNTTPVAEDDIFRQHTDTVYLADGGQETTLRSPGVVIMINDKTQESTDSDVLRQHTDNMYLDDGDVNAKHSSGNMEEDVLRQHTETIYLSGTNVVNRDIQETEDDNVRHHTETIYFSDGSNVKEQETLSNQLTYPMTEAVPDSVRGSKTEDDVIRHHTEIIRISDRSNVKEENVSDDNDVMRHHTDTIYLSDGSNTQEQTTSTDSDRETHHTSVSDNGARKTSQSDSDNVRHHTETIYFSAGSNVQEEEQTASKHSVKTEHIDVSDMTVTENEKDNDVVRHQTDTMYFSNEANDMVERSDHSSGDLIRDSPENHTQSEVNHVEQHENPQDVIKAVNEIQGELVCEGGDKLEQNTETVPFSIIKNIYDDEMSESASSLLSPDMDNAKHGSEIMNTYDRNTYVKADTPERRTCSEVSDAESDLIRHEDNITLSLGADKHKHALSFTVSQRAEVHEKNSPENWSVSSSATVTKTANILHTENEGQISSVSDNVDRENVTQDRESVLIYDVNVVHGDRVDKSDLPGNTGSNINMTYEPGNNRSIHISVAGESKSYETNIPQPGDIDAYNTVVDRQDTGVEVISDEEMEETGDEESDTSEENAYEHRKLVYVADDRKEEESDRNMSPGKREENDEEEETTDSDSEENINEHRKLPNMSDNVIQNKSEEDIKLNTSKDDNEYGDEERDDIDHHRSLVYDSNEIEISSDAEGKIVQKNGQSINHIEEDVDEIREDAGEIDEFEIIDLPTENKSGESQMSVNYELSKSDKLKSKDFDDTAQNQSLSDTESEDDVERKEFGESAKYDFESSGEILETAESKFTDTSVADLTSFEKSGMFEVIDGPEPLFTSSTVLCPEDRHRYLIQDTTDPDENEESDVYDQNISAEHLWTDHELWDEFIDEREVTTASQIHLAEEDSDGDNDKRPGQRSSEDISDNASDESDNSDELSSHRQLSQSGDNSISIDKLSLPDDSANRSTESLDRAMSDFSPDVNKLDSENRTGVSPADKRETIDNVSGESLSVLHTDTITNVDTVSGDRANKTLNDTEDLLVDNMSLSMTEVLDSNKSHGPQVDENKSREGYSKPSSVTGAIDVKTDSHLQMDINENSRGEVEGSPAGKTWSEPQTEDRLEEADVKLVEADADSFSQRKLTTQTADHSRLKSEAESLSANQISADDSKEVESSNRRGKHEHEISDNVWERQEHSAENLRLEVGDDSKHATRHNAKSELAHSPESAHVEDGGRSSGRKYIDTSEASNTNLPVANTDADSQGNGNSQQILGAENVDYGSSTHLSDGRRVAESGSRLEEREDVGGYINRAEEIDGRDYKNKCEESGAVIDGKTENRVETSHVKKSGVSSKDSLEEEKVEGREELLSLDQVTDTSKRAVQGVHSGTTERCTVTSSAHSGESGTGYSSHSTEIECATETFTGETERSLNQTHHIEPDPDNRQPTQIVRESIEDRLEQADILNVTGGVLHEPAFVEGENVCMKQIHESACPNVVSRDNFVSQDRMADQTSPAIEGGEFGVEVTHFTDRTEKTLPLEKRASIETRVQYRVKKLTKTVTKTNVNVKKVQKKKTGDAVEHEHLRKVEQLTVVSQKVWSSTESLDKDEPLEEKCQVSYKATYDKTRDKDGHQLPSAHFETSYTGEIPVEMPAFPGESEDILALCGPEAVNAASSSTSSQYIHGAKIENSPEIHISQMSESDSNQVIAKSSDTPVEYSKMESDTESNKEAVKSLPDPQTELIDESKSWSINMAASVTQSGHGYPIKSKTPDESTEDKEQGEQDRPVSSSPEITTAAENGKTDHASTVSGPENASPTHTERIEIFISPKSLSPVTVRRQRWSAERSFTDDKLICTLYEETVNDVTVKDDSALYILEDNIHMPATERLEQFVSIPSKKAVKPQAPVSKPLWTLNLSSLTPVTSHSGEMDERREDTGVVSLSLPTVNNDHIDSKEIAVNDSDNVNNQQEIQTTDIKVTQDDTQNSNSISEENRQDIKKAELHMEVSDSYNDQKSQVAEESSTLQVDEDSIIQALSNVLSGERNRQQSTYTVTSISHTREMYDSDENMNEKAVGDVHVSEASVWSLPSTSDSKQGLTAHGDVRSLVTLPDTADLLEATKFSDAEFTSFTETDRYADDGENYDIFLDGCSTEQETERTEQFIEYGNECTIKMVRDGIFSQVNFEEIDRSERKEKISEFEKKAVDKSHAESDITEERYDIDDERSVSEITESERVVESSERETITSGEEGDDESDEKMNNDQISSYFSTRIDNNSNILHVTTAEAVKQMYEDGDSIDSSMKIKLPKEQGSVIQEETISVTMRHDVKTDTSSQENDKAEVSAQGSYPNKTRAEAREGGDLSGSAETNRDGLLTGPESTDVRDSLSTETSHPTYSSQFSTQADRCEIRGDNDSFISPEEGVMRDKTDKTDDTEEIVPSNNTSLTRLDITGSHAQLYTELCEQPVFTSSSEWGSQIPRSHTQYTAVETGDSIDDQQTILSAPSAQVDSASITSGLAYSGDSEVGKLNARESELNNSSLESAAVNDGMLINGQSFVEQHAGNSEYANVTRALDGNEISILKEAETFGGSSRREFNIERAVTVSGEFDVNNDVRSNIGESDNESSDYDRDNKVKEFTEAFIKFSIEELPLQLKQRYDESITEPRERLTSVTDAQSEEMDYQSKMSQFDYDDWTKSETAQKQIRFNSSTNDGLRLQGDCSVMKMGDVTSSEEINRSKDSDTSFDRLEWLETQVHTEDAERWQTKSPRVSVLVTGQVDNDMEENNNYEKEVDVSYGDDSDNSDLDTSGSQYSATVTCELKDGERSMSPTSFDERFMSVSEHMLAEFKDSPEGKSRLLSSASSDGYFSSAGDQTTGELRLNVSSDTFRHYSSTSSEGYHSFISDQMTGELKHSPSSDVQKLSPSTFDEIEDTLNNSLLELENLSVNLSHDETDAQMNESEQRTFTTSVIDEHQRLGTVKTSASVVKGTEIHRPVVSENSTHVRFVTENVKQRNYDRSSLQNFEQGQFQDSQSDNSAEDRGHYLRDVNVSQESTFVNSEKINCTNEQSQVNFSQKYSSSDHVTRQFNQGGAEIPTWRLDQGGQTTYTQSAEDKTVQRQVPAVESRSGQFAGQSVQFRQQTFGGQSTDIQYGGIISGNLSSEDRRHQVGQGSPNIQNYSSISSSMSEQSRIVTTTSQTQSFSSEHSQRTIMSSQENETYENVPESMSESVKDELLKKSHGYFSSSVSVNLSKKWKMFEKLWHSFDEFSWQGNLAPHLFTFVFQKSVENQTDVVDQFEKLYPLLLIEDVERCQNHICTALYTDTYQKQRKMQRYFLRGFTKDLKRLWHSKRKQSLAPLCVIPEERIVSFSDCASVSLPTCHTTSVHPSLVSFQPVAKSQFNRFFQQADTMDTSTSENKGDNSFDSGEDNSVDSLQYICQGDLSDPTIMLSKRLRDLSREDNPEILDDVLLRGLRHYRSKFMRFNPYVQVDLRRGARRAVRTETIYEEEEDERYMD